MTSLHAELVAASAALMPHGREYRASTEALEEALILTSLSEATRASLAIDPHDAEAHELAADVDALPNIGQALARWLAARRTFNAHLERLERARAALTELSAVEAN